MLSESHFQCFRVNFFKKVRQLLPIRTELFLCTLRLFEYGFRTRRVFYSSCPLAGLLGAHLQIFNFAVDNTNEKLVKVQGLGADGQHSAVESELLNHNEANYRSGKNKNEVTVRTDHKKECAR